MKKRLSLLLALCLLLTMVPVKAGAVVVNSGPCGDNLQWSLDSQGTLTISGNGPMKDWPAGASEEFMVPWLRLRDDIISLVVEEGVTYVGDFAFTYCHNLKQVSLPKTLTGMGESIFEQCISLENIVVPDSVTQWKGSTFEECISLRQVKLPERITDIPIRFFYKCYSLQQVEIPKTATNIGFAAFESCQSLTFLELPEGLTTIGENAFADCVNLFDIWLPESLEKIGNKAFAGCVSLTSLIIPPNVKDLGNAFQKASALETLIFTGHAPAWRANVFDGVTATVFYPHNHKSWSKEIRRDYAGKITWVAYVSDITPEPYLLQGIWGNGVHWTLSEDYTLTLSGMDDKGNDTVPWSLYTNRIKHIVLDDSITEITDGIFYYHGSLKSIELPKALTTIRRNSFQMCTALETIIIPDSVTRIGDGAFDGCICLSNVRLPKNITKLEINTFRKTGISWIELPESLTEIGRNVFGASKLTAINLPDGLKTIESGAFKLTNLTTVVIPASVTTLNSETFGQLPPMSIYFLGDPPKFENSVFNQTEVTAYYPANNPEWRAAVRQDYGGQVTWIACDHVHNYIAEVTEATCTAAGGIAYTCADCGDSFVQPLSDALGHDFVEATCIQAKHCQRYGCGYTVGSSLGHSMVPASCELPSYCEREDCGYMEGTALGHKWNDENAKVKTCTVCGVIEGGYRINLDPGLVGETDYAWIDGVPYYLYYDGEYVYTEVEHPNATNLVLYYYNDLYAADLHTQYPTGMKVWMLNFQGDSYSASYVKEFDDLLQYAGSSIRITGKKGIRMITSITKSNKQALTGKGLAGYKLVEYGTALAWVSDLAKGNYLTLGESTTKSNYAYKRGVADPVFKDTGKVVQYTNVLVGFSNDQCGPDIAMRPYIILEDASGKRVTVYGGIVYRSIAYIAYQNRNAFSPGTSSYEYVWSIIHHIYGKQFDKDYKK